MARYRQERELIGRARPASQPWRAPAGPMIQPPPTTRWVVLDGEQEALLVEWRREADGTWWGLVSVVVGPTLATCWVPAHRLSPHSC